MNSSAIDQAIVDPKTFAREESYHDLYTQLRRDDPVHWTEPGTFRPFWTISKHADIMEIERQNDIFLNDPRTILQSIDVEDASSSRPAATRPCSAPLCRWTTLITEPIAA